ncbi:ankyrin repeat protein, putative [Trichomonas vaginalis G3]|uniref:Ankyrin repeat protein, putative n=1 Tax=Trichomonas vaginalis (strain ATCC PRA-98 / G3) TaxID=412133 RepID=A2EPL7_TRIV3|nr:ankyrin repeat protein, putative [Trichomonas vaginalis G3]|eukprot:XP_001317583.1 ankyrin repeat protein [Trichomonas vaginalis G3]
MELFIKHGAVINAKDNNGQAALHIAAQSNNLEIARFLILHGADIHAKDKNESPASHLASRKNYKQLIELLIFNGGNPPEKDNCIEPPKPSLFDHFYEYHMI